MRPLVRLSLLVVGGWWLVVGENRTVFANHQPPTTNHQQAQDVQAFHDGIVSANKRLKSAGFRVAQPLPALLAGNRDELPRFRAARDDAVRTVKMVEEQLKLLVPPDSESARALLAAERQFLA